MGTLIQRTIPRLEATKLDQNAKSSVTADVVENMYFQLKKRMESRWQGRLLCITKTSQDPTVFASPKTQAIGFTKKAKRNYEGKKGTLSRRPRVGYRNLLPAQRKKFIFCATSRVAGDFLPMPSAGKGSHFYFILIIKPK